MRVKGIEKSGSIGCTGIVNDDDYCDCGVNDDDDVGDNDDDGGDNDVVIVVMVSNGGVHNVMNMMG